MTATATTTATAPPPSTAVPPASVRRGANRWLSSYRAMVRWHLTSLRLWLAMLALVQVLAGVGFVLGIALFFEHIPDSAALFVSTGVPVINLVLVGMILGPQLVADQKVSGSYEYLQSMPVPRSVSASAWYTVTLIGGIPPVLISLAVAQLRYGLDLQVSWTVVPALLLTALAGTMLGYALGHALSSPMATRLITQLLVFAIFGFAPILFPLSQLPGWLDAVNWWFPFRHMAVVVRASLTGGPHPGLATAYLMLVGWTVVTAGLAARALGRRR